MLASRILLTAASPERGLINPLHLSDGKITSGDYLYRIRVINKAPDPRAAHVTDAVGVVDCYALDIPLSEAQTAKVAGCLYNPVSQCLFENLAAKPDYTYVIEIGFLPGVTDNIGNTVRQIAEDALKITFAESQAAYSSIAYLVSQAPDAALAATLYNPLIQYMEIKTRAEFESGVGLRIPKVFLKGGGEVVNVDLNVSDNELEAIGTKGIMGEDGGRRGPLGLALDYMQAIQKHFKSIKRNPTDIELETLAQTWSEHCKHTIFASPIDDVKDGLYKHFIKRATNEIRKQRGSGDFCVSVFTDNAGAITFDDNWLITDKVETHNSPSALDPFGGAITGIVGVNRDCIGFGLGAKPIANRYGFCFAPPETGNNTEGTPNFPLYRDRELKNPMLPPSRIIEGVVRGVNVGGNCSGIPTPAGFVYFDHRFAGKPLVYVGTVGLIPRLINGKPSHIKQAKPGDAIVVVGGRVGRDGIHGATFSSVALDEGSPASAVQIGDPITQKKMADVILREARNMDLYNSITDNGAGGLSSSIGEMGRDSGGFLVELEKVPLKYPGMNPWEIWISESQERMTLSVPPHNVARLIDLFRKRGVEATEIGHFTDDGYAKVSYQSRIIMNLAMDFLHNGLPERQLSTINKPAIQANRLIEAESLSESLPQTLLKMLARLNICSKENIATQYDHEVQGTSVLKPLQGKGRVYAEATIIKPVMDSVRGVVMSHGINPAYGDIDTYHMAACVIDTAIRNAVAAGANPDHLALLDNFCWCSSNDPYRLYQLKRAAAGCYDYAVAYLAPFISGKDSMFNDFSGYDANGQVVKISAPPTLLISALAVIDDITRAVSLDFKNAGDYIYILGSTRDEMGGSEYIRMRDEETTGYDYLNPRISGGVPVVDASLALARYKLLHRCNSNRLVESAIAVNLGGIAVALAKKAIGGTLGAQIHLDDIPASPGLNTLQLLFSESQSRIVLSVKPENADKFEDIMGEHIRRIGTVIEQNLTFTSHSFNSSYNLSLQELAQAYKSRLDLSLC